MATVAVTLDYPAALSTGEFEKLSPGQAHWWLRRSGGGGDFVRLPKRIRGDQPLKLVVHLEPGNYTLGVGPAASGMREEIEVVAAEPSAAPPAAPTGEATIDLAGMSIVITGDLDAMDRDAAKAWLVGLGAKVTTSVSSKTNLLVVGRDPGQKKLEKAAELGTRTMTEVELRAALGVGAAPAPQVPARPVVSDDPQDKVKQLLAKMTLSAPLLEKVTPIVGPQHFSDLGMEGHELWGIATGPRGGSYLVYIDLDDRPKYALRCNCRARDPCKHGYALLLTAERHFIPPVPPPEGHAEAARQNYYSSWE